MNNDIIFSITSAKLLYYYEKAHKKKVISVETTLYFDVGQKSFLQLWTCSD